MRSSRLLALLLVLQRRQRATAAELAAELEVSVRTLYRDVAALVAAGFPLWTEPGPHGGIRLVEGWRTRLDGLPAEEASALFLSGAPQAVADLGLGAVAMSARAKVDATLPAELRDRAGRIRERFLLDAPAWFARPEPLTALPAAATAVWEGRKLELRHGGRPHSRRVDPLGLVLKAGTWYWSRARAASSAPIASVASTTPRRSPRPSSGRRNSTSPRGGPRSRGPRAVSRDRL